jgi:serine/threonine protein kinase
MEIQVCLHRTSGRAGVDMSGRRVVVCKNDGGPLKRGQSRLIESPEKRMSKVLRLAESCSDEMVTGRRPFEEKLSTALTNAIIDQGPNHLAPTIERCLRALENIIIRALDKDPDHRYQSARDLRVDWGGKVYLSQSLFRSGSLSPSPNARRLSSPPHANHGTSLPAL